MYQAYLDFGNAFIWKSKENYSEEAALGSRGLIGQPTNQPRLGKAVVVLGKHPVNSAILRTFILGRLFEPNDEIKLRKLFVLLG